MESTDQLTNLVMRPSVLAELHGRALAMADESPTARALLVGIMSAEPCGTMSRVRCSPAALGFIRTHAPHLAEHWPSVFPDVGWLTVRLDVREVRALAHVANTMADVWLANLPAEGPIADLVDRPSALERAAMKLEMALTMARQEL